MNMTEKPSPAMDSSEVFCKSVDRYTHTCVLLLGVTDGQEYIGDSNLYGWRERKGAGSSSYFHLPELPPSKGDELQGVAEVVAEIWTLAVTAEYFTFKKYLFTTHNCPWKS